METVYREPTAEECSANAAVDLTDGIRGIAAWYPQMGGYGARCVIVPEVGMDITEMEPCCHDVYVWHDGTFPFSGEYDFEGGMKNPTQLHHCDEQQFVEFGNLMARAADMLEPAAPTSG